MEGVLYLYDHVQQQQTKLILNDQSLHFDVP